jgi:hypothetical protein
MNFRIKPSVSSNIVGALRTDSDLPCSGSSLPRGDRFWIVLVLLHLLVVLPLAYFLNIWTDEASTLHTTQHGLFYALQHYGDERQAPLYFLLLSVWRMANGSIFFARLFSILCSCLAIKFFTDLASRFFALNQIRFIGVLFALHPFLVWASLEIRVYSLVILLSVLLLNLFARGYVSDSGSRRKYQIAYVAAAVVSLYTNYYLGFLLAGCFSALIVLKKWKSARDYFLHMIVAGALTSPLYFVIKQQIGLNTAGFSPPRSIYEGLKTVWNHAINLVFPTELSPQPSPTLVSTARIWLLRFSIIGGFFVLIRNQFRNLGPAAWTFGTISLKIAGFLLIAYFLLGAEYLSLRHAAALFVPLGLFVFSLLSQILPRKSWIFFAAVFAFLYPYSIYQSYSNLAKRGDWARVARFIETNETAGQPVVVFQNYDALSLPYYYRGVNPILPNTRFFDWSYEADPAGEDAFKQQTEFIISQIPAGANEIWLATEDLCQQPETAAACAPLENYIGANYTIEINQDFYLERVRLLRKKQ